MKLIKWLKGLFSKEERPQHPTEPRRLKKDEYLVSLGGQQYVLSGSAPPDMTPQAYVDRHAVQCASCGGVMVPGSKFCVAQIPDATKYPGKLSFPKGEGDTRQGHLICMREGCGRIEFMCGMLEHDKKLSPFESILSKAISTGKPVVVADVSSYKG